jgi:hypothetical protein
MKYYLIERKNKEIPISGKEILTKSCDTYGMKGPTASYIK